MSDKPKISFIDVFPDNKARRRFLKVVGADMINADQLESLISRSDAKELISWLNPIYEAQWGAIHHGNSARFSLYHFNGHFFASFDCDGGMAQGPFKTAIDAAEAYSGALGCVIPEDDNDCVGAVSFSSRIDSEGKNIISKRTADAIFAVVTGYKGVLKHHSDEAGFDWAEVIPGVLFIDPFKDEVGKELQTLYLANKNRDLAVSEAVESKIKKLMRKENYFDFTFDNSGNLFKSTDDSFVAKMPMNGAGKLSSYPTQWIRLCMPSKLGRRIKLKAGVINMHWSDVSKLVSTGISLTS